MRASRLQTLIYVAGFVAAAGVGRASYYWQRPDEAEPVAETVQNWREYSLPERELISDGRLVSIVLFTDYQCPFCRTLSDQLDSLRARHPREMKLEVRHFPLENKHPYARQAALAVECATDVGKRVELNSLLYHHQESIGGLSWGKFGALAAIKDTVSFTNCIARRRHDQRVDTDIMAARQLNIRGTPVLLLNDQVMRGVRSMEALEARYAAAKTSNR